MVMEFATLKLRQKKYRVFPVAESLLHILARQYGNYTDTHVCGMWYFWDRRNMHLEFGGEILRGQTSCQKYV
jgi:hypothetical protein